MCVVAHNFGAVLVGLCVKESIEAIESACKWPAIEWTSRACFGQWRDVPFTDHVVAVSMWAKHLGQCSCFVCDLAAIARVAAVEVCKTANTN